MYRRDAMLRQISEAVALGNAKVGTVINTKKERNYVQLLKFVVGNGDIHARVSSGDGIPSVESDILL